MSDTNDILRKLAAQAGGEAALSALERALSSADGRRAVSSLSASHEALLRAAADRAAAVRGEAGMLPHDLFAPLGQLFAENRR